MASLSRRGEETWTGAVKYYIAIDGNKFHRELGSESSRKAAKRKAINHSRKVLADNDMTFSGGKIITSDGTPFENFGNAEAHIKSLEKDKQKKAESRAGYKEQFQEYKDLIKESGAELSDIAETRSARQTGEITRALKNALLAQGQDPSKASAITGRAVGQSQRGLQDVLKSIEAGTTSRLAGAKKFEIGTGLSRDELDIQRESLQDAMTKFIQDQQLQREAIQAELDMQPAWYESVLGEVGDFAGDAVSAYATYKIATVGGGGSCFDGNSMVHGISKDIPIHLLNSGNMIRTTEGFKPVKRVHEYDKVSDLSINGVKMTGSHPIIMKDGSLKLSKDIVEGDILWGGNLVVSAFKEKGSGKVYNLDIESDTYHVEGMLVHTGRKGS